MTTSRVVTLLMCLFALAGHVIAAAIFADDAVCVVQGVMTVADRLTVEDKEGKKREKGKGMDEDDDDEIPTLRRAASGPSAEPNYCEGQVQMDMDRSVVINNLGGLAATGDDPVIHIRKFVDLMDGRAADLIVSNLTAYVANNFHLNGLDGDFNNINIKAGFVDLLLSFTDTLTQEPLTMPAFNLTIYDIDGPKKDVHAETVEIDTDDFTEYKVTDSTAVIVSTTATRTLFGSSAWGVGCDNPSSIETVGVVTGCKSGNIDQRDRAVAVQMKGGRSSYHLTLRASDAAQVGRNFLFGIPAYFDKVCHSPTQSPTPAPTSGSPSLAPTSAPTGSPSSSPTSSPTGSPTSSPSAAPTSSPTGSPSYSPTMSPSSSPTLSPSSSPTMSPSSSPTSSPTGSPSSSPTMSPSSFPTMSPSSSPTMSPSSSPTSSPTESPSSSPTMSPSSSPTMSPSSSPTMSPSSSPTMSPSSSPTMSPSSSPTSSPTGSPSSSPTMSPSSSPTMSPSSSPTMSPSSSPTSSPTGSPSTSPTMSPSSSPTMSPSSSPTMSPSSSPTMSPSSSPTMSPSSSPTSSPTGSPSSSPTMSPSSSPTLSPSYSPTSSPTGSPTSAPTSSPTVRRTPPPTLPHNAVTAFGDPHVTNLEGERFDILQADYHTFLVIPRGADEEHALLHVVAKVDPLGQLCSGLLYVTSLRFSGRWVGDVGSLEFTTSVDAAMDAEKSMKIKAGPSMYLNASRFKEIIPQRLGEVTEFQPHEPQSLNQHVDLLVVKLKLGPSIAKVRMVYQKEKVGFSNSLWLTTTGLGRVHDEIGGILGFDDHTFASSKPSKCVHPDEGAASLLLRMPAPQGSVHALASFEDVDE